MFRVSYRVGRAGGVRRADAEQRRRQGERAARHHRVEAVQGYRVVGGDPAHAQALAYLGDIELKKNSPVTALPLLNKAVHLRKDIRVAYLDIGAILSDQKKYPEALAALQHAENMDPSQPDAHYRLARLYRAMGNTSMAQKEFAKVSALQEQPEDLPSKLPAPPPSPQ